MADPNPKEIEASQYKTDPPLSSTPAYRQRPATLKQIGRSTSFISNGDIFSSAIRPHYYQLVAWDNARRKEPIIKDGIDKIILALINKIGECSHPDNEISDFINANLTNIRRWVSELATSAYWAGFGVSEIIWERREGKNGIPQVWVEDIVNYHPTQVEFKLNLNGRLTHGEKLPTQQLLTGVWIPSPPDQVKVKLKGEGNSNGSMIRLPRSKVIHTYFGTDSNNPYGSSQLSAVLDYHLFKEAFRDMMAIALDRYGTPLIYAIVPPHVTGEMVTEPDGTIRPKTYREVAAESLGDLRSETAVVFEQLNKEHPVSLGSLTTGNNYADAFKEAIEMCDHNMMVGMGIPNLIVRDTRSGLGAGNSAEIQVQMFHTFISSMFRIVINDFLNSVVSQLIAYNFDSRKNKLAVLPATIKELPFRFADIESLMGMVTNAAQIGVVNPSNQEDFNHIRALMQFPHRNIDNVAKAGAGIVIEAGRPKPQPSGSIQPSSPTPDREAEKGKSKELPQPFKDKIVNPSPKPISTNSKNTASKSKSNSKK